jgi:hypothetical protein
MSAKHGDQRLYKIRGLATRKKTLSNGSRTNTKPGISYRVYCTSCEPVMGRPEESAHVTIDMPGPKVISCKNGHLTEVRH